MSHASVPDSIDVRGAMWRGRSQAPPVVCSVTDHEFAMLAHSVLVGLIHGLAFFTKPANKIFGCRVIEWFSEGIFVCKGILRTCMGLKFNVGREDKVH